MGLLFKVNTNRFDPYKNYRFLVYFRDPSVTTPSATVRELTGAPSWSEATSWLCPRASACRRMVCSAEATTSRRTRAC